MSKHNVIHIKTSSKSVKHKKLGVKCKDCIYYNKQKYNCQYHPSLCTGLCPFFLPKDNQQTRHKQKEPVIVEKPIQAGIHELNQLGRVYSQKLGTSCHVGYIATGQPRRHKSRCKYYKKQSKFCINGKSPYCNMVCPGSSRCQLYRE